MDIVDRELLVRLATPSGWPSVSIYMPAHPRPLETDQDRIRLKNLVRQASANLVEQGMRESDAETLSSAVRQALDSDDFWREGASGVAAFMSTAGATILRLDVEMPEQVTVGDRFYLRPLMRAYRTEERFFVLALDKNLTRLFKADATSFTPLDLGDAPATFDEAMKYDDQQKQLGHRSFDPGRPASRGRQHSGSVYSGHGGEGDVNEEQMGRFARMVERGVARALANERAPLLLLGIDRLLFAYRAVNTYANLLPEQVLGAMDYRTDGEIETLARTEIQPRFEDAIKVELNEIGDREGTSLASHDPAEIVAAAASGRVRTLFFDDGTGPYGTFDRERMEVDTVCSASPRFLRETGDADSSGQDCGWDLVDLAVAETALHGGEVVGFTGEESPVKGVAALYRY